MCSHFDEDERVVIWVIVFVGRILNNVVIVIELRRLQIALVNRDQQISIVGFRTIKDTAGEIV